MYFHDILCDQTEGVAGLTHKAEDGFTKHVKIMYTSSVMNVH